MISGGTSEQGRTVELFAPEVNKTSTCMLPIFNDQIRRKHTSCGLLVCGGERDIAKDKCITLSSSGTWETAHTLLHSRSGLSSFQTSEGIILIGGWNSLNSTEIIKSNGDGPLEGFSLKYKTRYLENKPKGLKVAKEDQRLIGLMGNRLNGQ